MAGSTHPSRGRRRFAKEHGIATVPVEQIVVGAAASAFNHTLTHYLSVERAQSKVGLFADFVAR